MLKDGPYLGYPEDLVVDAQGNLYVSDSLRHVILRISPQGKVARFAGGERGFRDGSRETAQFASPEGLAVDAVGNLYVADSGNHRLRRVSPSGQVETLAGAGFGKAEGPLASAQFRYPAGLSWDPLGGLLVADAENRRVCRVVWK